VRVRQIAVYLLLFLVWNVVSSLILALSIQLGYALPGLAVILGLYVWFLAWLLRDDEAGRRRWVALRLRELRGPVLHWTLLAVPVLLVLSWALGEVYVRMVPVPPESFDPFGPLLITPTGRLALTIFAVGIAPVLEEFFFRGFIQHGLERRFGSVAGIGGAAAVFALIHVLPWVFPLHFFLGVAFGYAVYATRSIGAGVILHAANNAVAMTGLGMQGEESSEVVPTLWQVGPDADWWLSLAVLVATAALAVVVARGLRNAGRERSLRLQPADR
jgi:membrane protease YdiL (CAAX protease family)